MSTAIDAIYKHGVLRPLQPLALPADAHVRVSVKHCPTRRIAPRALPNLTRPKISDRWRGQRIRCGLNVEVIGS